MAEVQANRTSERADWNRTVNHVHYSDVSVTKLKEILVPPGANASKGIPVAFTPPVWQFPAVLLNYVDVVLSERVTVEE